MGEPPTMKPVWIVDDDRSIRWVLEKTLAREGIPFKSYASATEALSQLDQGADPPQVLLSDIRMPGQSGLELLQEIKNRFASVPVIIMTGYSSIEHAVLSIRHGAPDTSQSSQHWAQPIDRSVSGNRSPRTLNSIVGMKPRHRTEKEPGRRPRFYGVSRTLASEPP